MTPIDRLSRQLLLAAAFAATASAQTRDTCAKWERPDRESHASVGETALNPVVTGRWKQLVEVRRGFFSMRVPASARITGTDSATRIDSLPDCIRCMMTVSWFVPKAPIDSQVKRWIEEDKVAAQRSQFATFDARFPPRRVTLGSATGYWMVGDCGDCDEAHLYVEGKERVAHVHLIVDGNQWTPGPMCHMQHAAESFRWIAP